MRAKTPTKAAVETQAREDDQQGAGDVRPARKPEGESDAAQSADPAEGERLYVFRKQRERIRHQRSDTADQKNRDHDAQMHDASHEVPPD